jgi:hypothetical protein
MQERDTMTCPQCFVGKLQPRQSAFTGVLDGVFLSVPDMQAHICDVCGYREFAESALIQLEALLGELPPPGASARAENKRVEPEQEAFDRLRSFRLKP